MKFLRNKSSKITIINILLILSNCLCFILLLIVSWKSGYMTKLFSFGQSVSAATNVYYDERISLFEEYDPDFHADIVFVGDSITQKCDFNELFGTPTIANRGILSDTTAGVLKRIDNIAELNPKKIFIMIGINDIGKKISKSDILSNYDAILDELKSKLPKTEVYVESILPVLKSNSGIKNIQIIEINTGLKELSQKHGYTYVDAFSQFYKNGVLDENLTLDGVHLNGKGYSVLKECLREYV